MRRALLLLPLLAALSLSLPDPPPLPPVATQQVRAKGEADFAAAAREALEYQVWSAVLSQKFVKTEWDLMAQEEALVYFENTCGFGCGGGDFFLLEHGADGWDVKREWRAWIQ